MHEHLTQTFPSPMNGGTQYPVDPRASVNYQRTREMTIDELLLENRVVFLVGEINHASAARVMMQMLYLENQKRGQDIQLYINSPAERSTTPWRSTTPCSSSPVKSQPSASVGPTPAVRYCFAQDRPASGTSFPMRR